MLLLASLKKLLVHSDNLLPALTEPEREDSEPLLIWSPSLSAQDLTNPLADSLKSVVQLLSFSPAFLAID